MQTSQLFFVSQSYHSPLVVLNYRCTYYTIGFRLTYSSVHILSFLVVVSPTKVLVIQLSPHSEFAPFTVEVSNLRYPAHILLHWPVNGEL